MTNAHWGYWGSLTDDTPSGRHGSLRTKSKNLGDGMWCQTCLKHNFYNWLDFIGKDGDKEKYQRCTICENIKRK